jgi:hypothetical protein
MSYVYHNKAWSSNDESNSIHQGLDNTSNAAFLSFWDSNQYFRWQAAGYEVARLSGAGNLNVVGEIGASNMIKIGGSSLDSMFAFSNAQSNWNYASNVATNALTIATWTSNAGSSFASNTAAFGSNVGAWASNSFSNYSTTTAVNATYAASNGQSNWNYASNTAGWASNNSGGRYWTSSTSNVTTLSNVGVGTVAPTRTLSVSGTANVSGVTSVGRLFVGTDPASNSYYESASIAALAGGTTARMHVGNQSAATPGIFMTYNYIRANANPVVGDTGLYPRDDSNCGKSHVYFQNDGGIAFATLQSDSNGTLPTQRMVIGSNGFVGIGTASPAYALEVAGDVNASNVRQGGALIGSLYAASNGQSNWNYGSNTAVWGSNALSNYLSLATASNAYAASNGQSNWNYGSNTASYASNAAVWGSNNSSNFSSTTVANSAYAASNSQSNWNYGSNTASYASNTAVWGSNVAVWGSNAHSNYLSLATASNAYAASNGQSNWNYGSNTASYASNTAVWGSNVAVWGSNAHSNYLSLATASNAYAASNSQSNWNYGSNTASYASNTAVWGSNAHSNYLSLATASNAYAASNSQSNWN